MEMFSEKDRKYFDIELQGYKHKIPALMVNHNYKNKIGYILVSGLNGNKNSIVFFKNKVFNNSTIISYDGRAQGDNKNKSSRRPKIHVEDTRNVILAITKMKEFQNIKEWILIGESWGSSLATLYYFKYHNIDKVISKVRIWNMPYKVVNVSAKKGWEVFSDILKIIFTFATNIETKTFNVLNEKLINNKLVIRILKLKTGEKVHTKTTLAAWRTFKIAWKVFNKNWRGYDFKYIQSGEDAMCIYKDIKRFARYNKNIEFFDKGFHVASLDDNINNQLFKWIVK